MGKTAENEVIFVWNVPNIITSTRIVMAIVIAWLLFQGGQAEIFIAGILIIIAGLTDWLDGFLARKLGQTTVGGSLMDVVADEILVIPALILAIMAGLYSRTDGLMPFNPYPYAVLVLAGGVTVLAGVVSFLWKRRNNKAMVFPTPPMIAKINYSFWVPTLVVAVLGIGPDILLVTLMYCSVITTLLSFYYYLKKGGYVFTD